MSDDESLDQDSENNGQGKKKLLKKMQKGITLMAMSKNLEGDKFDGNLKNKEDVKKMQLRKTKKYEE